MCLLFAPLYEEIFQAQSMEFSQCCFLSYSHRIFFYIFLLLAYNFLHQLRISHDQIVERDIFYILLGAMNKFYRCYFPEKDTVFTQLNVFQNKFLKYSNACKFFPYLRAKILEIHSIFRIWRMLRLNSLPHIF